MTTILCYGDSNTWGAVPRKNFEDIRRFPYHQRWPGVLKNELGDSYSIIEEGLRGRTTVYDDPIEGEEKNGEKYLLPCLLSHYPLDLVILFLGTNDLKKQFCATPLDVARGVSKLIHIIKHSNVGRKNKSPEILLLSPPLISKLSLFANIFEGAIDKFKDINNLYFNVAKEENCFFINTSKIITTSHIDGIHFVASEHNKLGIELAKVVRGIISV